MVASQEVAGLLATLDREEHFSVVAETLEGVGEEVEEILGAVAALDLSHTSQKLKLILEAKFWLSSEFE